MLPPLTATGRYLAELTERARAVVGAPLVGVYVGGSYALGAYDPRRSDLDVAIVTCTLPTAAEAAELVERLRHESLPCPAQGLELVVYPLASTRAPSTDAGFALNLNTGARRAFRLDHDGGGVERHWFPLDRSILAQHGIALAGPPAAETFADIPRAQLLPVVLEALEWHRPGAAAGDDVVLNAVRGLRYALEGEWSSKPQAARWALECGEASELVAAALAAREGGPSVDPVEAERFREGVAARVRELVQTSADGTGRDA